ncbi:MAG: hypothetical protein GX025_09860 [Clostridiales bacterium]|nr:hypothetical protein [Clostridiales bacterium]
MSERVLTLLIAISLFSNLGTYAFATNTSVETENTFEITEKFVADSDYYVTSDSNGDSIIILSNTQSLPFNRLERVLSEKTVVAVLPSDEQEKEEIISNIENLTRGSGTNTEDGWFYGSSVYLTSTISYTTATNVGATFIAITGVTINALVNSGTSISSMSLAMGQCGMTENSGYTQTQTKTYNAKTVRSFTPPTSWQPVLRWDYATAVGAHLTCTVSRLGGSSTFTLYNSIS